MPTAWRATRIVGALISLAALSSCHRGPAPPQRPVVAAESEPTRVVQLVASYGFNCARLASGRVRCWGYNEHGQLGDGTRINRSVPVDVVGIDDAVEIASASWYSCARLRHGAVRCWGGNDNGVVAREQGDATVPSELPGLADASGLALSADEVCASRATGSPKLWCTAPADELHKSPRYPLVPRSDLGDATAVILASGHTCGLFDDGSVRCSFGAARSRRSLERIGLAERAIGLVNGSTESCAVLLDRSVRCWRTGPFAARVERASDLLLFDGPSRIGPIARVGLSGTTDCAVTREGHVRCWELLKDGARDWDDETSRESVEIEGIDHAVDVATAALHSCAVLEGGDVRCWGDGTYGELGDSRPLPPCVRPSRPPATSHVAIRVQFDAPAPKSADGRSYGPPPLAAATAPTPFIPPDALEGCHEGEGRYFADLFGDLFAHMHEPSLWAAASTSETAYRFTLSPTFARPLSVRIERRGGDARLSFARLNGAGGYDAGALEAKTERAITNEEWERVDSCAGEVMRLDPLDRALGNDGSEWLFESVRDGRYTVRRRWSPRSSAANDPPLRAFVACADRLLALAGVAPAQAEERPAK
ncbi:MAG: RCC1 domain-containing protein [Polyangiales bacterium]